MFRLRFLAVLLTMLVIGVPVLAQDESQDMGWPTDPTMVDSSDAGQAVDEPPPAEEVAPADEAPPAEEPAPVPTPPIVPAGPTPPVQAPQSPPPPAGPPGNSVQVTLRDDFTLTLSASTVAAGRITIVAKNEGALTHGLGLEGLGTEQFIRPGDTLTREVTVRPGTIIVYCPVSDHRSRGMQATLTVQ